MWVRRHRVIASAYLGGEGVISLFVETK